MNKQIEPTHVVPVNSTTGIAKPQRGENKPTKLWIMVAVVLVFLLLTAKGISPAQRANAQILAGLPDELGILSTSSPTATPNNQPARTPMPSSMPETLVKVYTDKFSIRSGPGLNYATGRKLIYGEELLLLGRLDDSSWLYIRDVYGTQGWISASWVRIGPIKLESYAIQTPSPLVVTLVKVLDDQMNLRTGPGYDYVSISKLSFGESLYLLGWVSDRTWLFVRTSDRQEGWVRTSQIDLAGVNLQYDYYPIITPPPTETSTPVILPDVEGHWIDVDLSEQKLRAYEGTKLVGEFLVSTGIDRYPTETGKYKIYVKYRYTLMHGSDYYLPDVPFTMFYSGDFSIHGTYWHHNFGHPMSHGCINMDIPDAEWIYNWADVGTLVNIHY